MNDPDTRELRLPSHRRTKIIATLGPATRTPEMIRELIAAGVDVFRLNFSHGVRDDHSEAVAMIREAAAGMGREIGILGDLPGPKLRLAEVADGLAVLHSGSDLILHGGDGELPAGTPERLSVQWSGLHQAVKPGDPIFLADGRVRLKVRSIEGEEVHAEVKAGGTVSSHQGVNLPGADEELPDAGSQDSEWVQFACDAGIDFLAVSFVRRPSDLDPIRAILAERESDIPLIAKIEKPQAAERAEEIIEAATGGIMVARGDLGVELPIELVPGTQKRLIRLAGRAAKPVITATQMLATMVKANRPTRAEVADVANAIYDGTDAVMLSEETAIGDHAVEAVRTMDRIARATETDLSYGDWVFNRVETKEDDVAHAVAQVTVAATYRLNLAAIVVPTGSGRTARLISSFRPREPVLALSSSVATVRRMSLLFGVRAAVEQPWDRLQQLLDDSARLAREEGVAETGELIAITAGLPEQQLGTNLFEVHRVP